MFWKRDKSRVTISFLFLHSGILFNRGRDTTFIRVRKREFIT